MIQVIDKLSIGTNADCFYNNKADWAAVHACKHPCHQVAVGYRGNLPKTHPNYLIFERDNHLFLNMVDMDMPLSHEFTKPIVTVALNFMDKHITTKSILVHCNLGQSRSPALVMLFLAKRQQTISNDSFEDAKRDFVDIFPNCQFGSGVKTYLTNFWNDLK